jgi:tRNA(fMet)-specific endonuclease VapC
MNGKILLDTNIIIALFAEEESIKISIRNVDEIFIPNIVLGELYYGAFKSTRREENLEQIYRLSRINTILNCDEITSRQYGEIKNLLRAKGRFIPDNDIWIAAIARQHNLILISRDEHFKEIENLNVMAW